MFHCRSGLAREAQRQIVEDWISAYRQYVVPGCAKRVLKTLEKVDKIIRVAAPEERKCPATIKSQVALQESEERMPI